jgi:ABC-2 type transport system ATP-binding protein
MVQALATEGMAVVWSTAYLDEAERCDSALLLVKRRLLFDGPPADLTRHLDGRSYRVVDIAGDRRQLLSDALGLPALRDGAALRLVRADDASVETLEAFAREQGARLEPTNPR